MKQVIALLVVGAVGYGVFHACRDAYRAHMREMERVQYNTTREAIDDSMKYHSGFLLEFPPESRRQYRSN